MDKRKVFVIHGRNEKINGAMFDFLRALGLNPREWSQLISDTGKGSPYVGEVIEQGIRNAGAVVALLTPDDRAFLHPALLKEGDPPYEKHPSPQARPNVLFEMGMAFALQEKQTIIVKIGEIRPFSDIGGRHVLKFDGTPQSRHELKNRLKTAGCEVDDSGQHWLIAGDFPVEPGAEFQLQAEGENPPSLGPWIPQAAVQKDLDLEQKRQLVYAFAIEILTKLHGESFQGSHGLPGHLWSSEFQNWSKVAQQLVEIHSTTGRAKAIVEPSTFRSVDRGKMKAATKILEMYLWASDHNRDFTTIRNSYDLPEANNVRKTYHDAQLADLLV